MDWTLMVLGVVVLAAVVAVMLRRGPRPLPAQRAGEIFDDPPGEPFPGTRARVWALGVLYEAGVDADADPGYAVRVLRWAEPQLSQEASVALVNALL